MSGAEQHQTGSSVGERLHAAREAAGLSIADVAQRTRVNARHLGAIERGEHGALPAAPYTIGFVKAFARAVGLDSAALSGDFRREWDHVGYPAVEAVRYEPSDPTRLPSRLLAWTAAIVALLVIAGYATWRSGVFTGEGPEQRARMAAGTDRPVVADAPVPVAPPVAPRPAPAGAGPVLLTALEPAWIKVYERGGATLFQGELAQGQNYEVPVTAIDPLIRLGRAEVVRVSVGGREVAPLGPAARTVKDVSLKPDALLARVAPATSDVPTP